MKKFYTLITLLSVAILNVSFQTSASPVCNAQFSHYSATNNVDSVHFYPVTTNTTGATYLWSFGDGSSSSQLEPWHFYANAGSYYVCLTVSISNSSGSCTSTWCDSIHIMPPPPPVCNAHFYHYSSNTNADSVHFYPATTNASSYFWSFGDGSTSNQITPWHVYTNAGSYYACLTITISTSSGSCTSTQCDSIHVIAPLPPVCNAQFSHYSATNNVDSVHFYPVTTNATGATYLWSFGDGSTSYQLEPWHFYANAGSYYVCLTVSISNSSGNCTSTWCDSIHIMPPPPPVCNAHFYHYSSNTNADSVHFYPATTNASSYFWSFGDGSTSNQITPWHVYTNAGSYYACLTITINTSSGNCTSTQCDSIHVIAPLPPVCNAQFSHYAATNNVDSVHFYPVTTNTTGATYLWSFGDGSTSTQIAPWHVYANAGSYYACLTITISTSSGSCTSTQCDSIHVIAPLPPVCNAQFSHYAATNNVDSIHFYPVITNTTGATYLWSFGDGSTSSQLEPWHFYANAGSYYVCLTVSISNSSGNCTSTWCDSVHVGSPLPPVCNAHFYHYSLNSVSDSVHFYPATTNASSYFWNFGDGSTSTQIAPWHLFAGGTAFNVCLTITISNTTGNCTATWCDHIVAPLLQMVMINPNPMSEVATVMLSNVTGPVTFSIYDYTGHLLYTRDHLSNGNFSISNADLSSGLYFYRLNDENKVLSEGKLIVLQ